MTQAMTKVEAIETVAIPLTRGKVALVDRAHALTLSLFKWCADGSDSDGWYAYSRSAGFRIAMHTLVAAWNRITGIPDHINRNGLDNRSQNLRSSTASQNACNRRARPNKTGYRGVTEDNRYGRRFNATIMHCGKRLFIGYFTDAKEAALARDAKAKELFGDFAVLNFK